MEIYDEKMERIVDPDLTLGWLEDTVRRVEHEEVPAVQEIWHYETAAEYENGGRDGKMDMTPPDDMAGATPPEMKNEMREYESIGENT